MEQTHLGLSMDSLESTKLKYDSNIKEILADVQVLSRIVKHVVEEAKELDIEEIISCIENVSIGEVPTDPGFTNYGKIESVQTENYIAHEGVVTFDIRFELCIKDLMIKLIVNVEAQKSTDASSLHYHLENRIVYYLSRLISSQKNREFVKSDYDSIKKVYSIWLCMDASEDEDSIHKIRLTNKNSIIYLRKFLVDNIVKTSRTIGARNGEVSRFIAESV